MNVSTCSKEFVECIICFGELEEASSSYQLVSFNHEAFSNTKKNWKFNMNVVLHFYILGLMSWIWTNPSTEEFKFESPTKSNSYEDFNLEHSMGSWTQITPTLTRKLGWAPLTFYYPHLCPLSHLTLAKPKNGFLKTQPSHHRHYSVPSLVGKWCGMT